ncbi:NAD(P)H-hydrate dehydratase [Halpernia frigidisoli]|uniref:Bifunctional NAD(P)H-hydrate repair enzyme n=1 Tax=Halpernia frigidisoli TaxID=1125876 RepID=A0A1I3DFS0_9FLAO|nr:NAD(P)H-hydrate dehydratase [Halpernia frigidisoli]SFH85574.1 NAD(P)H-hydrate epimerase [Halpernia frigidisoli]
MKLFTSEQILKIEEETIKIEKIHSLNLMERAAEALKSQIIEDYKNCEKVFIFCGNGNNGGDGFALARLLHYEFFNVKIFCDLENLNFKENAKINFNDLKKIKDISINDFSEVEKFKIDKNDLVIDALFGIGLNRKIEGKSGELVNILNEINAIKIAVDIPSGLFSDEITPDDFIIFKADKTVSFQFWKKAFLYPETGKFCGEIKILDIGLSHKIIDSEISRNFIIDDILIISIYKKRNDFSNKGNFGNSVIIAGSHGKIGAAVLATKAALRSGSGLIFTISPECGNFILQTSAPEAMFINGGENHITNIELPKNAVCGIGPGLGTDEETEKCVLNFLKNQTKPLVIDADALNIISKNKSILKSIPENSILTPHPKEFERLFGITQNSFDRTDLALKMAKELKLIIVLKDHHTQIITPQQDVFYNITGNSGMAKGGSGDVLTGILTSLLSQKYSSKNAAIFGVWLHGKAGDFAAEKSSKESLLPVDLIKKIGKVFKYIQD